MGLGGWAGGQVGLGRLNHHLQHFWSSTQQCRRLAKIVTIQDKENVKKTSNFLVQASLTRFRKCAWKTIIETGGEERARILIEFAKRLSDKMCVLITTSCCCCSNVAKGGAVGIFHGQPFCVSFATVLLTRWPPGGDRRYILCNTRWSVNNCHAGLP